MKFSESEEKNLYLKIKNQNPESEYEIDFENIKNGKSGAENRWKWNRMKKLVYGRQCYSFEDLMKRIEGYFEKEKNDDFYENFAMVEKEDKVNLNMKGLLDLFENKYSY